MTKLGKIISCLIVGGVIAAGFYYADKQGYERGVEDGHMELLDKNSELVDQKIEAERNHYRCTQTLESIQDRLIEISGDGGDYPTVDEVEDTLRIRNNQRR